MKVLVTGSREWADEKAIEREFKKLPPGTTIVHGATPVGAEALADKWAMKMGFLIRRYPAIESDEEDAGKVTPRRNVRVLREEHRTGDPIALGLAFTQDLARSREARHLVDKARAAGIRVQVVTK
jgi:hypothetical protein